MTVTCTESSQQAGESLAGTAPITLTWLIIEHPGPWGRVALQDAHLDPSVRASLQRLASAGVGVLLARRPGRRAEGARSSGPEVILARTATGGMLLRRASDVDLDTLATWDATRVAQGNLPPIGPIDDRPVLLVCTQGRRDACCAVEGRALLTALETVSSDAPSVELWESSHIGGHRLAPVTLTLPSGAVHGRIRPEDAAELVRAISANQVLPIHLRGRTCLPAPLQAAEVALRQMIDEAGADAMDVLVFTPERPIPVGPDWVPSRGECDVEIRHIDGRTWRTRVRQVERDAQRRESCGGDLMPLREWQVSALEPGPHWT